MTTTFAGCRLVDPASDTDTVTNVTVADGRVAAVGDQRGRGGPGRGRPGVRAPAWSICTPTCANPAARRPRPSPAGPPRRAAGGFTAVYAMANTSPVTDSVALVRLVRQAAAEAGHCHVEPVAAITVGLAGQRLAPIAALAADGGHVLLRRRDPARLRRRDARRAARGGRCCGRADLQPRRGADLGGRRRRQRRPGRQSPRAVRPARRRRGADDRTGRASGRLGRRAAATSRTCPPPSVSRSSAPPRRAASGSPPRSPPTTWCSPTSCSPTSTPPTR